MCVEFERKPCHRGTHTQSKLVFLMLRRKLNTLCVMGKIQTKGERLVMAEKDGRQGEGLGA